MKQLMISVLLAVAFGAPAAMADVVDQITYTINFTGTGLLPTAGSFTWDPDTTTFTAFSVTWDGTSFDLTGEANSPGLTNPAPPCLGGATGGLASLALLTGACSPAAPGFTTDWDAGAALISSAFEFITFANVPPGFPADLIQVGAFVVESSPGIINANGQWTATSNVTPVPEPSSLLLMTLSLAAVVVRKRLLATPLRRILQVSTALAALLLAMPGSAQNLTSWVSHDGKDQNDCTINHPCRTFQRAHDATQPGGEVDVLDPGEYGTLSINRPITIDGGSMGYIHDFGSQIVILVNVNVPGVPVILRNLAIKGGFFAAIAWSGISPLHVEGISIDEAFAGIIAMAIPQEPVTRFLYVQDTNIRNSVNGLWVQALEQTGGLLFLPTAPVAVTIERSVITGYVSGPGFDSSTGLNLESGRTLAIHCTISGWIDGASLTNTAELNLEDSSIAYSSIGLQVKGVSTDRNGNPIVRIAGNNIHDNDTALSASAGGQIVSFGNNRIAGNNSGESPTGTLSLK